MSATYDKMSSESASVQSVTARYATARNEASRTLDRFAASFADRHALISICAAAFLVYANALKGDFVFDDTKQIVNNPRLRSWSNLFDAFTSSVLDFQRAAQTSNNIGDFQLPYYRPIFTVYTTLCYQLFGLRPAAWHLASIALHAAACVAIYFFIREVSRRPLVAAFAALLFAVHPLHVESVAWISGAPDPLMTIFYVAALLFYIRFRRTNKRKFLALSVTAYALALLTKEPAVSLPLALACWEAVSIFKRDDSDETSRAATLKTIGASLRRLAPFALVSLLYLAARRAALGGISAFHPLNARVTFGEQMLTTPFALVSYISRLIAPHRLSIVYGTSFVERFGDPKFIVPTVALSILAATLFDLRRKLSRETLFALALSSAPLLPVLNLRVFHPAYLVQDRYAYLPSVGFCWLVALALVKVSQTKRAAALAFAASVFLLACGLTVAQNLIWRDAESLWTRAVETAPKFWATHYNLGLAELEAQDFAAARSSLEAAVRLQTSPPALNNLALAQAGTGDAEAAVKSLRAALALDSHFIEARNNLGAILFQRGDLKGAREEFAAALAEDPSQTATRFNFARACLARGDTETAMREFEKIVSANPDDAEARAQLEACRAALNTEAHKR